MLKIFYNLKNKLTLNKQSKTGEMIKNEKSSNIENKTHQELENLYNEYQKKSIKDDVYYLLGSRYMKNMLNQTSSYENIKKYIIPILQNWDECETKIPLSLGIYLENKVDDPTIQLGIHRSSSILEEDALQDPILQSIMQNGLINNGSISQGAIESFIEPSKTISPCNNMLDIVLLIQSSYKESKGAILIEFPSNLVTDELNFKDKSQKEEIYDISNKFHYIKPKYLLGYISRNKETKSCNFYSKNEILQAHKENNHKKN